MAERTTKSGARWSRELEDDYRRPRAQERNWPEEGHPNGCWYCGSLSHPTDCCTDEQARMEAWG